jgi:hypothetical protein
MKLIGLENSNPDIVAGAYMSVARATWDYSRAHPSAPTLPCLSGHALERCTGVTARPHPPASGPCRLATALGPSPTLNAWWHPHNRTPSVHWPLRSIKCVDRHWPWVSPSRSIPPLTASHSTPPPPLPSVQVGRRRAITIAVFKAITADSYPLR